MRIERTVTTISWIPSEAFSGVSRVTEQLGLAHHDQPPPDEIGGPDSGELERLRDADGFRFANRLRAWIEVDEDTGAITGFAHAGSGTIGSTTLNLGVGAVTVPAVPLPDLQARARGGRRLGAVRPDRAGAAPACPRPGPPASHRSCSTSLPSPGRRSS